MQTSPRRLLATPTTALRAAVPLALGALLIVPGAAAAAKVSFRVEGTQRTLTQTEVTLPRAPVGLDGKPTCPGDTALGALDAGTGSRWYGKFYSSFSDYLVSRILGRTPVTPDYWTLWVNEKSSQTGACATKLKEGDRVLFYVQTKKALPLGLRTPETATAGKSFRVRAVKFSAKGVASPVAKALVTAASARGRITLHTNRQGFAFVTPSAPGRLRLRATAPGLVRSETDTVRVIRGDVSR